jgi:hypothetical protein
MGKLRFLLLDANIVIKLFELGLWNAAVDKCDFLIARTVLECEAEFYFDDEGQHAIDLGEDVRAGRVSMVDVPPNELANFLRRFGPLYLERLDPGEAESLAYLADRREQCLICSSDAIVFRVLAQLDRPEQGLSLEELLQKIGLGRSIERQFTKAFRMHWTRRGLEEKLRGLGLL